MVLCDTGDEHANDNITRVYKTDLKGKSPFAASCLTGSVLVCPWVGLLLVEGWAVVSVASEAGLSPLHMCDARAPGEGRGADAGLKAGV